MLAGGVDWLSLSLFVRWSSPEWFERLAEVKAAAAASDEPAPITIETPRGPEVFLVRPHGIKGHEWIVQNKTFQLTIGNWLEPHQRPSIMARITCEALWRHGFGESVAHLYQLLAVVGGTVESARPSRLDMCVDILLPAAEWRRDIEDGIVCRARRTDPHYQHRKLTGFSIGRGLVSARIYDKVLEIACKSGKVWMFDIWGIELPSSDYKIIRVEFQFRRERLKRLGIETYDDLAPKLPGVWSYCTRKWLRITDDAEKHHTHQKLRPWWRVVQDGFPGAQGAEPLVVEKAVKRDRQAVSRQAMGSLASLVALNISTPLGPDDVLPMQVLLRDALRESRTITGWSDEEFTRRVRAKQAKFWRSSGALDGPDVPSPDPSSEV